MLVCKHCGEKFKSSETITKEGNQRFCPRCGHHIKMEKHVGMPAAVPQHRVTNF